MIGECLKQTWTRLNTYSSMDHFTLKKRQRILRTISNDSSSITYMTSDKSSCRRHELVKVGSTNRRYCKRLWLTNHESRLEIWITKYLIMKIEYYSLIQSTPGFTIHLQVTKFVMAIPTLYSLLLICLCHGIQCWPILEPFDLTLVECLG